MGWEGVGGGRKVQEVRDTVFLWLIHVDVWQKPTHCKTIILQLKVIKRTVPKLLTLIV